MKKKKNPNCDECQGSFFLLAVWPYAHDFTSLKQSSYFAFFVRSCYKIYNTQEAGHIAQDVPDNTVGLEGRDIFSASLIHFGSYLMLTTQVLNKCILFDVYFLHQKFTRGILSSQVQGLPGLQTEFKARLGKPVKPYLKIKSRKEAVGVAQ